MSVLEVATPEEMHALGVRLGAALRAGDVVVLTGPLGAGKTTLTRGIGEGLQVRGPVTSPTFVLARTHPSTVGGPPLVHVDAYRLGSALELDDLDIDLERSVVVAEWGEGLLEVDSLLALTIERPTEAGGDPEAEPRRVRVEGSGPRWAAGTPV
ncbi:MAG: tsaE [Naasia sp.]|nr:tsaE [Naasia sp.]